MSDYEPLSKRPTGGIPPREVLRYGITESALDGETALFDVLPGVGKSRSIPKVASGTAIPITVLTNLTDNYDQFERWGREDGLTVEKLPTRDLCPTLRDDNPAYTEAQTAIEAREALDLGWPVSAIHREFDLPCEEENVCPYRERINEIDPGDSGLLVGHYKQAYNSQYLDGRGLVIDEGCFDQYVQDVSDPSKKAQEFIDTLDNFPFDDIRLPDDCGEEERQEALLTLESTGLDPQDHRSNAGEFHAMAPRLTYAFYSAEEMANGWYQSKLPGGQMATFTTDFHDGVSALHLLDPPDFSNAEFVIALDATPCVSEWKQILGEEINHYRLYDDSGRNRYLNQAGYEFVQLNSHAWPSNGGGLSLPKCESYLREIGREHGRRPDLISSDSILEALEDQDLDHLWRDSLHYGDLRGRNDLAESDLLAVLGSPSRGDDFYEYQGALHGVCAQRVEGTEGVGLSFGSEVANDILETTRRGGVFQAAMRAGRVADANARVYIATCLVPEWLDTSKAGRERPDGTFDACLNLRSEGEKQVIKALQGAKEMSPGDLYDEVDISRDGAKKHRQVLQERGLIEKQGERRWARYSDCGLNSLNIAGSVDLNLSVCFPLDNSIRASTPIESRPEPVDPRARYPDWMLTVQHRVRQRRESELTESVRCENYS